MSELTKRDGVRRFRVRITKTNVVEFEGEERPSDAEILDEADDATAELVDWEIEECPKH